MHPSTGITKEYSVTLDRKPSMQDLEKIGAGCEVRAVRGGRAGGARLKLNLRPRPQDTWWHLVEASVMLAGQCNKYLLLGVAPALANLAPASNSCPSLEPPSVLFYCRQVDGAHVQPVAVALDDTDLSKPNRIRVVVSEGRNREVRPWASRVVCCCAAVCAMAC